MEWAGIAGGRCPKALWRVGVAGASVDDPQRALVLTDKDWQWLSELLPWSVLHEYGNANGLSFEPLSDVDTQSFDALLLVVLSAESQQSVYVGSESRRYLLLLDADQCLDAKYEQDFARIFMPAGSRFNDERLICLNPAIVMAEPLTQRSFEAGQVAIYGRDVHDAGKAHFAYCRAPERSAGWLSDCWLNCLRTGMVPVHMADWPVPAWIPENSYVDGRRFPDLDTLELFLNTMAPEDYRAMVEAMQYFRAGPESYPYSIDAWINALTAAVAADAAQARDEAPLISVIIPSYNYGRFIGQTVASVLAQGVQSLEVLVLDNASSDETAEVMRTFATDARVRFMRNRRNIGPSHNVLNGVRIATGQFMTVLMADDVLLSGHFLRLLPLLQAHPEVAVGYAPVNYIDERGMPLASPPHPGHRAVDYVGGRNEVADLLIFDNYVTPSASIIRRHAFLTDWRWNPHLKGAGDWDMVVQLAEHNPDFIFTSTPGVGYRVHQAQHSTQFYASVAPLEDHVYIVEGVFERGSEGMLRGRERDVAAHLRRRLDLYPGEQNSLLGKRVIDLCTRLESLAVLGEQTLFSIILTTYNRPELLKDALSSVGSQTLRDFEVILINDNGEPVEHLLAAYDFPITYIRQGRNQGLSAARNAGLRQARGRFVVYLDDDDIYLPHHLAVLAEVFERQPWAVAYTGVEYVNERLEKADRIELSRQAPFAHEEYDKTRLFIQNYIPVNTWAHPRSMLAEVGEFDTKLTAFEDWDMLLRLAARYHFVHAPQITAEVHLRDAPNTGSDHMLGREQKNFGSLYREMYRRHSDLDSDVVRSGRRAVLKRFGVSDLSNNHQPASLTDWLEMRVLTSTQERLVKERLEQNGQGPSFGVLLLDLKAERQEVLGTLASLGEPHNLYANIEPVVFTTSDSLAESFSGEIVNVTKANWVLQINTYLATARFDWLVLVKAGDEFTSAGLLMAGLELLGAAPDFRAIYCDELYRQNDGSLGAAFRPSMNLDYLLSFPAGMAQHWIFRREVLVEVGGFNPDYPEALEFELILRFVNVGGLAGMGHVDEPLLITSPPALVNVEQEQRIVIRHLHERGYKGASIDSSLPGRYLINYGHADKPLVSILISVEDQLPILLRCVTSVMENTRYANYEILLLEDSRASREVREWLIGIESMAEQRIRVLRFPEEAGQDAICNQAAAVAQGEYLVLLSQCCAVISEAWLDEMLNHALRPEVGIVGSELINKESTISHAGLVLGLRGPATSPFEGEALSAAGYMQRLQVEQNYSAVSSDCLMVSKELWGAIGGLDEVELSGTLAGVDLCLRAREAGFLTVWSPRAKMMIGREPKAPSVEEADALYAKWLPLLARDPAYNANFSLVKPGGFKLADTALSWRPLATWRPLPVVLAHPADQFGCGHYRLMQPFKSQQDAGLIDGALSMGLMHVADLERYDPDVILLQRQIGEERLEAMRRMKAFSRAFKVYELDDYLPNVPMKSAHKQHMPKDIVKSLRRALSYVDRFVVSTEALADAFSSFHHDIRVAENKLPPDWWQGLQGERRISKRPRVGWAGGAGHTGDLELIADVVKALADEVDWIFFGMCPEKLRPYVKEFHVGVEISLYPAALARLNLDLALAPLEQNLFNECKSNLRLLEYGACGFPVVCSDVGNYRGGLPVTRVKNRFKDWVDAIRMHLADLDTTARQGDELRSAVLSGWMLKDAALMDWRSAWLPDAR